MAGMSAGSSLRSPSMTTIDVTMRGLHAPVDRRRRAAIPDALQATDVGPIAGKASHDVGCPVGRIVVDDDRIPGPFTQCLREAIEDERDVAGLVVGRHDDRKIRHRLTVTAGPWPKQIAGAEVSFTSASIGIAPPSPCRGRTRR